MFRNRRDSDCKSQKSIDFSPVNISLSSFITSDEHEELFQKFADATSIEEQIPMLRKIIDLYEDTYDTDVIKFMVVVFLQADAGHPVKCFISRYVTKNNNLQKSFASVLASQISTRISAEPTHFKEYVDVVSKVVTCIENFNAGAEAVKIVENELVNYLTNCLNICVELLPSFSNDEILSKAEENEILKLSHHALCLLLHIVQKENNESLAKLIPMFTAIGMCVEDLMLDHDVPLETKFVCGILYIHMYIVENGPNSWIDFLDPSTCSNSVLNLEASRLSLYSAIATVVSVDKLEAVNVNGEPAILSLLSKILEIGESTPLKSVVFAVARIVYEISKFLEKIKVRNTGLKIVDSLMMYAWSHLDHYLDSVKYLTSQMLDFVLAYCIKLDRKVDNNERRRLNKSKPSNDTQKDAVPAEEIKEQKTKEVVFNFETEIKERKIEK